MIEKNDFTNSNLSRCHTRIQIATAQVPLPSSLTIRKMVKLEKHHNDYSSHIAEFPIDKNIIRAKHVGCTVLRKPTKYQEKKKESFCFIYFKCKTFSRCLINIIIVFYHYY